MVVIIDSTHTIINELEELDARIYSGIYKIKNDHKRADTDKIPIEIIYSISKNYKKEILNNRLNL